MRHLKTVGAALVVAAISTAWLGAGSASATVLCKTTANPCPAESKLLTGTKVETALPLGVESIVQSTDKEIINTWCQESAFNFTILNAGSATETVKATVTKWSWGGCTNFRKLVTLKTGELEIHYREGTGTGTLRSKFMEITAESVLGNDCVYGTGTGTDLGSTREPGALETKSQIEMSVALAQVGGGGFCPPDIKILARYTINTPAPLYVAGS
jgi:hypothetical protein